MKKFIWVNKREEKIEENFQKVERLMGTGSTLTALMGWLGRDDMDRFVERCGSSFYNIDDKTALNELKKWAGLDDIEKFNAYAFKNLNS